MSRAAKTPNPYGFLSDAGISHLLITAKSAGQSVDDIMIRVQSWSVSDDIDPTWIDDKFAPDYGKYFQNPHCKDDDALTACFQNRVSKARDVFWEAAFRKCNMLSKQRVANGETALTSEEIEFLIERSVDQKCPKLGHSGQRKSTSERISKIEDMIDIDLSGLSVIFAKSR